MWSKPLVTAVVNTTPPTPATYVPGHQNRYPDLQHLRSQPLSVVGRLLTTAVVRVACFRLVVLLLLALLLLL